MHQHLINEYVCVILLDPTHRYKLRVLFGAVDMPWSWPVDANYHESKAFCAWRAEQDRSPIMWVWVWVWVCVCRV